MPRLENWAYETGLRPFSDVWSITGLIYGDSRFTDGSNVRISRAKAFNRVTMELTTRSVTVYLLGDCRDNLERQIEYIREDIGENLHT